MFCYMQQNAQEIWAFCPAYAINALSHIHCMRIYTVDPVYLEHAYLE